MLETILKKTKCSFSLVVNQHRGYYLPLDEHFFNIFLGNTKEIEKEIWEMGRDVYEMALELDTLVELTVYPDTPIGSYTVYHYDVNKALQIMNDLL